MSIESFEHIRDYFSALATSHVDINSFVIGPARRILEKNRSKLTYPVLWLELPEVNYIDNGAHWWTGDWDLAILILKSANPKDFSDQDQVLIDTDVIARQAIAKLMADKQAGIIDFEMNSAKMNAVSTLHLNSEFGWRIEFTIPRMAKICYDPAKWA